MSGHCQEYERGCASRSPRDRHARALGFTAPVAGERVSGRAGRSFVPIAREHPLASETFAPRFASSAVAHLRCVVSDTGRWQQLEPSTPLVRLRAICVIHAPYGCRHHAADLDVPGLEVDHEEHEATSS
jgi:hypothetical protein